MTDIRENCRRVFDRIHNVAGRCGRKPESIRLIAVTKTVSPVRIREALESGVCEIGENKLQEALSKKSALQELTIRWHFIGHLQTNKARKIAENFDCVQSVDRPEVAHKLNACTKRRLPVLVEVDLGNEETKSGVSVQAIPGLLEELGRCPNLDVRGFMAIPPFSANPEEARPYFRRLRGLAEQFHLPELSMGMSHDFETAIEEGATMVRIGTALFGERLT